MNHRNLCNWYTVSEANSHLKLSYSRKNKACLGIVAFEEVTNQQMNIWSIFELYNITENSNLEISELIFKGDAEKCSAQPRSPSKMKQKKKYWYLVRFRKVDWTVNFSTPPHIGFIIMTCQKMVENSTSQNWNSNQKVNWKFILFPVQNLVIAFYCLSEDKHCCYLK